MTVRDVAVLVLVAVGLLGLSLAAIGTLRARGALSRLHYAGLASTVGAPVVAVAIAIERGLASRAGLEALLVALVSILSGPVSTHAIGRAVAIRRRRGGD